MSTQNYSLPAKVTVKDARRRRETKDGGFEIGVLIDIDSHGSEVLLGVETIKPGTERVDWTADRVTHEVYYVQSGRVRISWEGDGAGEEILGAGDSFYFPPARTYQAENVGEETVRIVWSLAPSPPNFLAGN